MHIRNIIEKHKSIEMLDAVNILAIALSLRKEDIFTNLDLDIDEKTQVRIEGLFRDRKKGRPFAYIAKNKEFFSESFYVDEGVLIPRPETEVLVEEALVLIADNPEIKCILDMGTGSGAIGLTIAKKTQKHVICADISLEAIRVARRNSDNLGVPGLTNFVCSDLFSGIRRLKFDMILANLPYIALEEWDTLMTDVKGYEPRIALDGGAEGTAIYKRLIEGLPQHLKENGYVLCEVGGCDQANKIKEMFREIGLNVVVKKDLAGKERVLIGSWISSL